MKVLGTSKGGYICEVSHAEIEKFLNQYYGKMKGLNVGDEVDLARGYDFANRAEDACKKTAALIESNGAVIRTIMDGVTFLGGEVE